MSRSLFADMEMDLAVFTVGVLILMFSALFPLSAQDFGFGFGDEGGAGAGFGEIGGGLGGRPLAVSIGGEVSASIVGYVDDFADGTDKMKLGDIFAGKLNFAAETSRADAVINLNLRPQVDSPIAIDEAYLRAYFGSLDIEGGLRKLTWGKADSFGPLDVINPLDNTEITDMSDLMNLKTARPLIHTSYRIGSFSKLEGVFVPTFEPIRLAEAGNRWRPGQMAQLDQLVTAGVPVNRPDTATLNYAQAGARFTTTIGSTDIGVQYYYGRLTKPAITMTLAPPSPLPSTVNFAYNPYHQIGADWAQVLVGFNVRAEIAANITEDLSGDDGAVYNPHLAWSFGFDRDLLWGVNLNIQANETITLLHNKIADNLFDVEADADVTSTQIIAALSKNFLRDELEARVAVIWEPEAGDFLITPSLVWTKDAVSVELSGGIFGGDDEGPFGQYRDNGFVKMVLTYTF